MCWTLCAKKNLSKSPLLISDEDAFKVWVIFNFLSEDKYPLIIVPEEVRNKKLVLFSIALLSVSAGYVNDCYPGVFRENDFFHRDYFPLF